MNILRVQQVILRALGEDGFARKLQTDFKAAVSEYGLNESESKVLAKFSQRIGSASAGGELALGHTNWFWWDIF